MTAKISYARSKVYAALENEPREWQWLGKTRQPKTNSTSTSECFLSFGLVIRLDEAVLIGRRSQIGIHIAKREATSSSMLPSVLGILAATHKMAMKYVSCVCWCV